MNLFAFLKRKTPATQKPSELETDETIAAFEKAGRHLALKVIKTYRFENESSFQDALAVQHALENLSEDFEYRPEIKEALEIVHRLRRDMFVHLEVSDADYEHEVERLASCAQQAVNSLSLLVECLKPENRDKLDKPSLQGAFEHTRDLATERQEALAASIQRLNDLVSRGRHRAIDPIPEPVELPAGQTALEAAMEIHTDSLRLQTLLFGYQQQDPEPATEALQLFDKLFDKLKDDRSARVRANAQALSQLTSVAEDAAISLMCTNGYLDPKGQRGIWDYPVLEQVLAEVRTGNKALADKVLAAVGDIEDLQESVKAST